MAREQFMVEIDFILRGSATAEPMALGAWLRLCAYCAERLLGGRIKGAKAWTDAVAFRAVGMPRTAFDDVVQADIGGWDGDDLVLDGYDLEGERLWKAQSKGGKDGNKRRWSNRTPIPTPNQETEPGTDGPTDGPPESETDVGDRIREGVGEGESDSVGGSGPRARAAPAEDARIAAAAAAGGLMRDPETRRSIVGKWTKLFDDEQLTRDQVETVFAEGKRLTGYDVRYPSGFAKALEALRKERRAEQRKVDQAKAADQQRQQRELEQQQVERDRARSVAQVAALDAWLSSDQGAAMLAELMADPVGKRWLEGARKHSRTGAGANLALRELIKLRPQLDRFWHLGPEAGEGSAA